MFELGPGSISKAIGVYLVGTAGDGTLPASPTLPAGMGASALVAARSSAASVPPLTASVAEARQCGQEEAVPQLAASQAQAAIAAMLSGNGGRRVPPGTLSGDVSVGVTFVYWSIVRLIDQTRTHLVFNLHWLVRAIFHSHSLPAKQTSQTVNHSRTCHDVGRPTLSTVDIYS